MQSILPLIKAICKNHIISDAKAIEHLHNEKEALRHFTDLNNKNISSLIGTFQDESNIYLLLEMVKGLPLHKLLQMEGPFPLRLGQIVLAQVAEIMRQFHSEGFIYRDIKASNFMIDKEAKIKMIDLGKAKRIKRERAYTICGTTHSIPPEA